MASTNPNTVILRLNGGSRADRPTDTALVSSGQTVSPGDLILFSSGTVQRNGAGDADAPRMVALEKEYLDPQTVTTAPLETSYSAGESCRFIYAQPGDKLYMFLADSEDVSKGAALDSAASGALRAASGGRIIAFADEDKTASGKTRIRVRMA